MDNYHTVWKWVSDATFDLKNVSRSNLFFHVPVILPYI